MPFRSTSIAWARRRLAAAGSWPASWAARLRGRTVAVAARAVTLHAVGGVRPRAQFSHVRRQVRLLLRAPRAPAPPGPSPARSSGAWSRHAGIAVPTTPFHKTVGEPRWLEYSCSARLSGPRTQGGAAGAVAGARRRRGRWRSAARTAAARAAGRSRAAAAGRRAHAARLRRVSVERARRTPSAPSRRRDSCSPRARGPRPRARPARARGPVSRGRRRGRGASWRGRSGAPSKRHGKAASPSRAPSPRGENRWANCQSSGRVPPARARSGPIRRVPQRCGVSGRVSQASVGAPKRAMSACR